ncbi:hypothetical protein B0H66DRAFT_637284 [Apodospora peruviana]|uniref:Uncharacterized protein n=1 Tax=Apodospora peruviana TaxID=516989 RepID=A0AAE0IKA6_9PEZI|nr:hypothetical protein B0H66DRAFT_637284 [Apodospora peruviana]
MTRDERFLNTQRHVSQPNRAMTQYWRQITTAIAASSAPGAEATDQPLPIQVLRRDDAGSQGSTNTLTGADAAPGAVSATDEPKSASQASRKLSRPSQLAAPAIPTGPRADRHGWTTVPNKDQHRPTTNVNRKLWNPGNNRATVARASPAAPDAAIPGSNKRNDWSRGAGQATGLYQIPHVYDPDSFDRGMRNYWQEPTRRPPIPNSATFVNMLEARERPIPGRVATGPHGINNNTQRPDCPKEAADGTMTPPTGPKNTIKLELRGGARRIPNPGIAGATTVMVASPENNDTARLGSQCSSDKFEMIGNWLEKLETDD